MSPTSTPVHADSLEPTAALDPVSKAFARHETFHLRYGWLKKGFDAALADPEIFLSPDAAVRLGVGKNMVRAIRYWCRAFKVLDESPNPERPRMHLSQPSDFGRSLLDARGWDPYLENPASLWLLHWRLLQPPCEAPTWYAVFNGAYLGNVTDVALFREVALMRDARPGWGDVVDASLKKDVDCLLRTYAPRRSRDKSLEDSLDCPFASLGLMTAVEADRHLYHLNVGPKEGLADEVLVAAMLEFLATRNHGATRTMLLSRLAYDENGPGRVFRVSESNLRDAALRYAARSDLVAVTDVAGSPQLLIRGSAVEASRQVLGDLYRGGEAHAG